MVWLCIPSARPLGTSTVGSWEDSGYGIALWRDPEPGGLGEDVYCNIREGRVLIVGYYQGYASAVNALVEIVLRNDPECEWVVTGGDDVLPDPEHSPGIIAQQCSDHFRGTFGVMQPTGDRWGDDALSRARWPSAPAYIDRVAGSPWIGREFAATINGGRGPIWHEYTHMFEDEELQNVAIMEGAFWQRPDLTHYHQHWQRQIGEVAAISDAPAFLRKVSGREHWVESEALFRKRKAAGFPGHERALALGESYKRCQQWSRGEKE